MSFAGSERRQSPRIRVRVPVLLGLDGGDDHCETVEIGQGGVFVATFEQMLLQQLVELRLELSENEQLDVRGMVVRIVDEEDAFRLDTEPGVGIQFYGVDEETENAWKAYFERTLEEAGFFEDADASTLKGELSTIDGAPPVVELPEPVECLEDAQAMLSRGFSIDQVSRAAGLDPSIVAAALEVSDEANAPDDNLDVGRTVEGISLLSARPDPFAFEEEAPTTPTKQRPKPKVETTDESDSQEPSTVRLKPDPSRAAHDVSQGTSTSLIKIIGPESVEGEPLASPKGTDDVEPIPPEEEPTEQEEAVERETDIDMDLEEDGTASPRIRLVALGPLQPPPVAKKRRQAQKKESSRPRLVPALSEPLAPTSLLPHVVYRLEMPTVASLEEFQREALDAGGVFILTVDLRPGGTPVIVCVVHPVNHDEFHIPGTVTHSLGNDRGVNVKFTIVTELTIKAFERFIAQGKTISTTTPDRAYPSQEITMVTKTSEVFVEGAQGSSIPRDTQRIKLSEIEPLITKE